MDYNKLLNSIRGKNNKILERKCNKYADYMKSITSQHDQSGNLTNSIYAEKINNTLWNIGTHGCNYAQAVNRGRGKVVSNYPNGPMLYDSNSRFFKETKRPWFSVGPAKGIGFIESTIEYIRSDN